MPKIANVTLNDDQKIILLKERVEVIPTDANKFQKTGKPVMVHPAIAEKGRKNGIYEPEKKSK